MLLSFLFYFFHNFNNNVMFPFPLLFLPFFSHLSLSPFLFSPFPFSPLPLLCFTPFPLLSLFSLLFLPFSLSIFLSFSPFPPLFLSPLPLFPFPLSILLAFPTFPFPPYTEKRSSAHFPLSLYFLTPFFVPSLSASPPPFHHPSAQSIQRTSCNLLYFILFPSQDRTSTLIIPVVSEFDIKSVVAFPVSLCISNKPYHWQKPIFGLSLELNLSTDLECFLSKHQVGFCCVIPT